MFPNVRNFEQSISNHRWCPSHRRPFNIDVILDVAAVIVATAAKLSRCKDDGDVSENRKKTKGLHKQNNNFACASRFFYISLPSLPDYDVKQLNFTFCGGRQHKTTTFFFFSSTLIQSFTIKIQTRKKPAFDELNEIE